MKQWVILLYTGWILTARGATYYIDYAGGADTDSGTSTTAAWKVHPYMQGFTGTYAHTAGDRFIFKGGVTWPNACFPLLIQDAWQDPHGGSSESNCDYYGIDNTWHAGNAWTRPVFDLQGRAIYRPFEINGTKYIRINNLEIKNHEIAAGQTWANGGIYGYACSYITVTDCNIHDWSVESGATDDRLGGIVFWQCGEGIVIDACHIQGPLLSGNLSGGVGISAGGTISRCEIHDVSNGILGGGIIHDNHIYDIRASFDPAAHENGVYIFGSCTFYNNSVHNVTEGTTVYPNAGWGGGSGTVSLFNNLIYDNGPIGIMIDPETNTDTAVVTYHVYNNLVKSYNATIRLGARTAGAVDTVYIQNNILITTGTWVHSVSIEHPVNTLNIDHNMYYNQNGAQDFWVNTTTDFGALTFEQSQAKGFDRHSINTFVPLDHDYRPLTATAPGVDAGADLSFLYDFDLAGVARPQGLAWDIGPYEYVATAVRRLTTEDGKRDPGQSPGGQDLVRADPLARYPGIPGDGRLYDLTGKLVRTHALFRSGIYLAESKSTRAVQKVVVLR